MEPKVVKISTYIKFRAEKRKKELRKKIAERLKKMKEERKK